MICLQGEIAQSITRGLARNFKLNMRTLGQEDPEFVVRAQLGTDFYYPMVRIIEGVLNEERVYYNQGHPYS